MSKQYAVLTLDKTQTYVVGGGFGHSYDEDNPRRILSPNPNSVAEYLSCYFIPTPEEEEEEEEQTPFDYEGYGTLTQRPFSPTPVKTETGSWIIEGCPIGTLVEIQDKIGGEGMLETITETDEDGIIEFELEDAGEYMVYVTAPLPYVMSKKLIRVSEDDFETETV